MTPVISFTEAASAIASGKVGVLPTDTVYGVVARAADSQAAEHLYTLKHREHKPGTVIAADIDQLVELGITRRYLVPVTSFWPGAISVVVPVVGPALAYLHQGKQSLAVRIPDDHALQELLKTTGPLLTSSANAPGKPVATSVTEAQSYFGDQVDFYVDGGDLSNRAPSTIVRVIDDALEVLRAGAVPINEKENR